jgi:hypothetical protein
MPEKSITHLARGRLDADFFFRRVQRYIIAVGIKLKIVPARQFRSEQLVAVRFRTPQHVIEVNYTHDNPQLAPQLEQQPQERNRIDAARHRDSNAIAGAHKFLPANVGEDALGERLHQGILQPWV